MSAGGQVIVIEPDRTEASSRSWHDAHQTRHLVIIARHYPALFEYVQGRFAGEGNVEVVLDRRRGADRRRRPVRSAVERRALDRRRRPHVDDALRLESMQIVTIC